MITIQSISPITRRVGTYFSRLILVVAILTSTAMAASAGEKKHVLLLAGRPSHAPGEHEHTAGVLLLAKCLKQGAADLVDVRYHLNSRWPSDDELRWADTILFYADGGAGHFLIQQDRLPQVAREMNRGCGFVCLHYAVEYPKDRGGKQALEWMGGYFEAHWSVNPHWTARYKSLPKHPVANGVKPFSTTDEWYFHMRFTGETAGKLTPILRDLPPESTMQRGDGPHSGNSFVRQSMAAKELQTTAWAYERPDGGRGFGFTGGHFHAGWANDNQRKLVLNALLWTAGADVPAQGVETRLTAKDIEENVRQKPKRIFDGKSFAGWEGDTKKTWRIEDGAIVGGSLYEKVPRNEFLATVREFENFELTLKYQLVGTEGFVNAGVQIRTRRIPNHHEVSGYQADIGKGFDGALYDESRRNKILAAPTKEVLARALTKKIDWNHYRIRAEGRRIRLWLNDVLTVDYTESDPKIPTKGIIALQIHGGAKAIVRYKDLVVQELGNEG